MEFIKTEYRNDGAAEYYISETERLVVSYDEWSEDPREWGWEFPTYIFQHGWDKVFDIERADEEYARVWAEAFYRTDDVAIASKVAKKYAAIFLDIPDLHVRVATFYNYRTPYNVVSFGEGESPEQFLDVFGQFLEGNVYNVALEIAETCECCHNTEWECQDGLSGIYADDQEGAAITYYNEEC